MMKQRVRLNRATMITLLLGYCSFSLSAWEWPLKNPWVTLDFSADWGGVFFPGVKLASQDTLVRSIDMGELVFLTDGRGSTNRSFPIRSRGLLVIEHPEGFRSAYSGLLSGSIQDFSSKASANKFLVKQNEIIGVLPQKANGKTDELFFQLLDNREGGALNPLALLPGLPDDRFPVISSAAVIAAGSSERIVLKDRMELPALRYQLYVQVRDILGVRDNRAPYALAGIPQDIRVIWNGTLAYDSQKLSLRMNRDNPRELVLSRNPFGSFGIIHPDDDMIYMGELTLVDGTNRLEIRASDLRGNRTSASFRLFHSPKVVPVP